ncbi:hypothetical protein QTP70_008902 [Hemibagrus guttatus]|uniref:Uncharacterized protein n=1 Tax=Hemibagrus guttatus TaxID=175788 RepID=A0AAE0UTL1_9TELE|nr:hypothetical protein QTP70_008902 [Hemibagrus guttatus]KAK3552177.1 hypothetical protein QTP86_005105 [Hemibagrus guttatus]
MYNCVNGFSTLITTPANHNQSPPVPYSDAFSLPPLPLSPSGHWSVKNVVTCGLVLVVKKVKSRIMSYLADVVEVGGNGGFIFINTVKSAELTNVKYPNIHEVIPKEHLQVFYTGACPRAVEQGGSGSIGGTPLPRRDQGCLPRPPMNAPQGYTLPSPPSTVGIVGGVRSSEGSSSDILDSHQFREAVAIHLLFSTRRGAGFSKEA